MIAEANLGKIKVLNAKNLYPDSLGLFYSAITDFLGWKHHCDEGIIMGLAPFGDPDETVPKTNKSYREIFDEMLIEKNEFEFKINLKYFLPYFTKIFFPKIVPINPLIIIEKISKKNSE